MQVAVNIGLNNTVAGDATHEGKSFYFDSWISENGKLIRVYNKEGTVTRLSEKVAAAIRIWRYLKKNAYINDEWSVSFGSYVISKLPQP